MKVALGTNIQTGPWGGGNQFASSLKEYLERCGVEIVNDLTDKDIDLILLAEPRSNLKISAFSDMDIIKYLSHKNSSAIVVHRVNECDERKGTVSLNKLLFHANRCADHTVFISDWLSGLFKKQWDVLSQYSVILNGGNTKIFNNKSHTHWNGQGKIKIVTHHWGGNWMKGFDIYEKLDYLIGTDKYKNKISFTYIGGLPGGFSFKHAEHIKPLSGKELALCLSAHHIYLTGSQNEPAGMHHIEGALCGLPLLYRNSGALPDYCTGYGVMFDADNFEDKLDEIISNYDSWANCMNSYPHTANKMCKEYYDLFLRLLDQREQLISDRKWNKAGAYIMMMRSWAIKIKTRVLSRFR
ncbi:MAG TPA: hypothetical protein ENH40_02845 [Nitrospirae bacterium]|nr:hypothetical protein [Nitrospirota bacterium]